jgi:L-methionine (R)-S-oxide reductase
MRATMIAHGTFTGIREQDYLLAVQQATSLWEADLPLFSNLANISALLSQCLPRTNWAGFYLWDEARGQLILGPFQGLVACTRIDFGKGVCGAAVKEKRTQRVPDVHEFPGHIACDSASLSEIVVPIVRNGGVLGVIDVDSPERSRFDAVDQAFLEEVASALLTHWPRS